MKIGFVASLFVQAKAASCRFDGVWLMASDQKREERINLRRSDASDADAEVALAQSHLDIGDLGIWKSLSDDGALDATAVELSGLLAIDSP